MGDKYCNSFGHECVEIPYRRFSDCEWARLYSCSTPIPSTSFCTCHLPTPTPLPQPMPPSTSPAPAAWTTMTTTPSPWPCAPYSEWPNRDVSGTTCDRCTALVDVGGQYGSRCDLYC